MVTPDDPRPIYQGWLVVAGLLLFLTIVGTVAALSG